MSTENVSQQTLEVVSALADKLGVASTTLVEWYAATAYVPVVMFLVFLTLTVSMASLATYLFFKGKEDLFVLPAVSVLPLVITTFCYFYTSLIALTSPEAYAVGEILYKLRLK